MPGDLDKVHVAQAKPAAAGSDVVCHNCGRKGHYVFFLLAGLLSVRYAVREGTKACKPQRSLRQGVQTSEVHSRRATWVSLWGKTRHKLADQTQVVTVNYSAVATG